MRTTLLLSLSILSLPVIPSQAISIPGITSQTQTNEQLERVRKCYEAFNHINNKSVYSDMYAHQYLENGCTSTLANSFPQEPTD